MKISAFRRFFLLILCVTLMLGAVPAVRAEGNAQGAREAILQAYEDLEFIEGTELTVNLKEYGLSVEELLEIVDAIGLDGDCLQPWYLDGHEYKYYESSGAVSSLILTRKDPALYDYDLVEQRTQEILAETVREGMSQWQIALSVHDYLVANCVYDETHTYREFYDVLVRGTAVCSGYAEAYIYLLRRAGIDCRYVSSEEMNHAWNIVCLDGIWYHVDATWDDPTADVQGRVLHKNFLLSDQAVSDEEHGHYNWEAVFECTDTSLDADRFWQGVDSPICFESSEVFYFREKTGETSFTLYRRDREGNETAVITQETGFTDMGTADGYRYYYESCGLDLVDGRLYYCDMKGVYVVNTDGSGLETLYSHDCAVNKTYILGIHVADGKILLTLADRDGNHTQMELELPGETHTHSYTAQAVAPTCSQEGYTLYSCQCGVSYQGERKPALEHTYDEGTVILEPAMGQPGQKCFTCTACGYTKTVEIDSLVNNPLTDSDGVSEEEYTFRRILVGVGVVVLILILRRKKR